MPKNIDPTDIRKLVKDGKIEFYVEGDNIYCRELPINGELFVVGKVEQDACKKCEADYFCVVPIEGKCPFK